MKKLVKKAVPQAARTYEEQLMAEINEDRYEHDKKPFEKAKPPKEINVSTTDPESGVFHKGEHKKCLAYTAKTGHTNLPLILKSFYSFQISLQKP